MKKVLFGLLVLLSVAAATLAAVAARFESKIRPNTTLGPIVIGGLTREETLTKLHQWWQDCDAKPLHVIVSGERTQPFDIAVSELGIAPDEKATISSLKVADFWDSAKDAVGAGGQPKHFDIQFHRVANPPISLSTFLAKEVKTRGRAGALRGWEHCTRTGEE